MGYIMCICTNPGVSQEDLSSYLKLNKGSVAKGIRPLIKEGYIRRVQNQSDRRAYQLFPEEKATELFAEAEKTMREFNSIVTHGMTDEEQRLFKDLILKACDNVMEAAGDDRHHLIHPGPPSKDTICR